MKIINDKEKQLIEWNNIILLFSNFCMSEAGKKLYLTIKEMPLQQALLQSRQIQEIKESLIKQLRPEFTPLFNVENSSARAYKGALLSIDEMYQISRTIRTINGLVNFFDIQNQEFPLLSALTCKLIALPEIERTLCDAITDDCELNEKRYPELSRLHRDINAIKSEIKNKLQNLVNSPHFSDHLQEKIVTTSGNKYVVLLKSSSRGKVKGTIIDTSSSGATFYFEPQEATLLNAKLLSKENELNHVIFSIIQELSEYAGSCHELLLTNLKQSAYLDFLYAAAKASMQHNFNPVHYSEKYELNLINAAHPLLLADPKCSVIKNTISFTPEKRGIIITGANTGGKTILLKTTAACVLLGRCGLPIPASPDSTIGNFQKIAIDMGDDQNLQQSLSTFSGQIVSVNRMINDSSKSTLLIIDEIISGTNPRHAAALAISILEHFSTVGASVIVSTHYPELKEFAAHSDYYINASVSFDVESLSPTYRLQLGTPGTSYAFEIARIYELRDSIVDRAAEFLSENEIISDQTIEQVNKLEEELHLKQSEILKLEESLIKQRENYYTLNQQLRQKIESVKEHETIEYIKQLERWKEQVSKKIAALQGLSMSESQQIIQDITAKQKSAQTKSREFQKKRIDLNYYSFNAQKATTGTTVFITTLEKKGTVVEINEKKKEALIALGASIKSRFSFDSLRFIHEEPVKEMAIVQPNKGSLKSKKIKASEDLLTIQTTENTIDLRGMRVDEALAKTEQDLDSMLQHGINAAVIIHGHGTGALKSTIREWLKSTPFISNFRKGGNQEGGDGVTIAFL